MRFSYRILKKIKVSFAIEFVEMRSLVTLYKNEDDKKEIQERVEGLQLEEGQKLEENPKDEESEDEKFPEVKPDELE
jgi:hypothetical protein